jgi:hypothetical protein
MVPGSRTGTAGSVGVGSISGGGAGSGGTMGVGTSMGVYVPGVPGAGCGTVPLACILISLECSSPVRQAAPGVNVLVSTGAKLSACASWNVKAWRPGRPRRQPSGLIGTGWRPHIDLQLFDKRKSLRRKLAHQPANVARDYPPAWLGPTNNCQRQ